MRVSCLFLVSAVLASVPAQFVSADNSSLAVSTNGRYLERNGKPFFWLGDTNWSLFTLYRPNEAKEYLAHRHGQGFTVVHVMIPFDGGDHYKTRWTNWEGQQPWIAMDPAKPNDRFFRTVDRVIAAAAESQLFVAIMPLGGSSGSFVKKNIFTAENVKAYGRWLGTRYKNTPNIIWVNGFDLPPTERLDIARALVTGLQEGDRGSHLITYHPSGGHSSSYFQQESWLAFNLIQAWGEWWQIAPTIGADYRLQPARPVVMAECAYEAGDQYPAARPITPLLVRKQAWWSYLSGGFYTYGHNSMWHKDAHWRQNLDSPGARQMTIAKQVLTSLPWWTLVPDQSLLVSGAGTGDTLNASARFSGGAVFYLSHPGAIEADLTKAGEADVMSATWWNPETGESRAAGRVHRSAKQRFSSPWKTEDAVLVLRAEP